MTYVPLRAGLEFSIVERYVSAQELREKFPDAVSITDTYQISDAGVFCLDMTILGDGNGPFNVYVVVSAQEEGI